MSSKQRTSETKRQRLQEAEEEDEHTFFSFSINDHLDILVEILRRLDGPTLCSAACVCRLWSSVVSSGEDSIWEHLCFRHVSPPPSPSLRSIVSSLGGFRRLCFLITRLRHPSPRAAASSLQLSLSLFSVDSYERLSLGGACLGDAPSSSSLIFLRKPVNVV